MDRKWSFCGGVGSIGFTEYKERGEIKHSAARGEGRKMGRGIDKNRLKQSQRQRKREKKRGKEEMFSLGSAEQVLSNKHR